MVKLRFANLNAELDGDPKEIASILRELNVVSQSPNVIIQPSKPSMPTDSTLTTEVSIDELFKKLPDVFTITQMIESMGKPFSFNLVEQQMKIFGRVIKSRDSKENQRLYSRFYDLHGRARDAIVEKYGGKWTTVGEVINGHKTTRYTWGADEEVTEPIAQAEKQIVDHEVSESAEEKPKSLFEF